MCESMPFDSKDVWSQWNSDIIGNRIYQFLNNKIDHSDSEPRMSPSLGTDVNTMKASISMSDFSNYSRTLISLNDYIQRLIFYTRMSISPVNLAIALLYLHRIEKFKLCEMNTFSIFRLFSTAYLIAFKTFEDPPVMKNSEYCKIAGVSIEEMNRLEWKFLTAINFDLGINSDADVCRSITRMLCPPKITTGILMSEKIVADIHRWSPDTAVDLEDCINTSNEYTSDDDEI